MAWYNATGKENDKSLYENNRVIDRCIFCGNHSEIKTTMTIYFQNLKLTLGQYARAAIRQTLKQSKLFKNTTPLFRVWLISPPTAQRKVYYY